MLKHISFNLILILIISCSKEKEIDGPYENPNIPLTYSSISVNGRSEGLIYENITRDPEIKVAFSTSIDKASVTSAIEMSDSKSRNVSLNFYFQNNDSVVLISPSSPLDWLTKYRLIISSELMSSSGSSLLAPLTISLSTELDSTYKFPVISDDELLTLVQKQTFRYFWEFGHPVSGMARERSSSGDIVTTGGTGFGIMAMIVAAERMFIERESAVERLLTICSFLKNSAVRYHGAFSHWIDGSNGQTVPFSEKDNGADLVETSFLFQGLLTARQYFNSDNQEEILLREMISELWEEVEWTWFQRNREDVLYWHWSPDYSWEMNHKIRGWDECLITYILTASSPSFPIDKTVYVNGWTDNGSFINDGYYYDYKLPLGPSYGGPLFYSHYSFLGLDPRNLKDQYAGYWQQNVNHSKINYLHCVRNPSNYLGYSEVCWGLSASDGNSGYSAHSPTNDKGVIAPTAAISSIPYTPDESIEALRFFYYVLGDRIWKDYGFIDSFNLTEKWFANDHLAIDQGPIIVMIENYRTGLIWKLFMSIPEIQKGLNSLDFTYQ